MSTSDVEMTSAMTILCMSMFESSVVMTSHELVKKLGTALC